MKKFLLGLILITLSVSLFAQEVDMKVQDRGWTPLRLCFTKGAIGFPEKPDVYGLNIGIPETFNYHNVQKIYGVDFACIAADAKVDGLQIALTNWSKGSDGMQMSFANLVEKFTGFQLGFANYTKKSSAVQFGLFNFARQRSTGVQIGLLNFMDKGFLPFFPLINFSL